ncbi:unnamed protein product [Gordionus sp. m RMFG-2023]
MLKLLIRCCCGCFMGEDDDDGTVQEMMPESNSPLKEEYEATNYNMAEIQNLQDINKEELINSVRFYPCLYDKRSIGYKNTQKNNSIWKSIAAENSIETVEIA